MTVKHRFLRRVLKLHGPPPGRLTEDDVMMIRKLVREGRVTMRALGKAYGLTDRAIQHAVHGHTWSFVPGALPAFERAKWLEGEKTPLHKLTAPEVRELLSLRSAEHLTYKALAA